MGQLVPVRVGETEFFVEVADGGGPRTVGLDDVFSFEYVRDTVAAIGTELTRAWETIRPAEATVEFGLSLTVRSGKLTGLIVDGDGGANLKITLSWKGDQR